MDRLVHRDEPLRGGAADDRGFRAPGVGIADRGDAAREQVAALGEEADDFVVCLARLAALLAGGDDDVETLEGLRHIVRIATIGIDDLADVLRGVAGGEPDVEVVLAVGGRGVDEAGARVVGDVVAGEHGDVVLEEGREGVKRVVQHPAFRIDVAEPIERLGFRRRERVGCKLVREHDPVAGFDVGRKAEFGLRHHLGHFVETIGDLGIETNGLVRRDRPRRCGPDHDMMICALHRKLHPHHRHLAVVVFHFGFGERRAFHRAPHDRLGAADEAAFHRHVEEFGDDHRLALEGHGEVGVVPFALDAEAAEFLALHFHPMLGIGAAGGAELVGRHGILRAVLGAELLLHLPFDRQAVAVPARQVGGVEALHLVRADDDVLDDLVERRAEVDVAVGVGRAVMEDEGLAALGGLAELRVEAHRVPALDPFGLGLGQAGAHREFGFGQEQRVAVVAFSRGSVGHLGSGLRQRITGMGERPQAKRAYPATAEQRVQPAAGPLIRIA